MVEVRIIHTIVRPSLLEIRIKSGRRIGLALPDGT